MSLLGDVIVAIHASDSLESVVTVALGLAEHSGTISIYITYRQAYMTRITLRSESARSGLS